MEAIMSSAELTVLIVVVAAFVVFAASLAWASWR
jgi:hypothetical protein